VPGLEEFYDPILERGKWRDGRVSGGTERIAERLKAKIHVYPRKCYSNVEHAVRAAGDTDRVRYIEGIALEQGLGGVVGHTWLEIEGLVADLTLPWSLIAPAEQSVYFGAPATLKALKETDDDPWYRGEPVYLDGEFLQGESG